MINHTELKQFVSDVNIASKNCSNEAQLRSELEKLLESICLSHGSPWSPYTLETYLKVKSGKRRFADAIHGAVVIEYEPPRSFSGTNGAKFVHACSQAEEYAELLTNIEGRRRGDYQLIVWDGETIGFGSLADKGNPSWDTPVPLNDVSAQRLLEALFSNGRPLVSELVLAQHVGPNSAVGASLIPVFFNAIVAAESNNVTTKTKLLFAEWSRVFGQVVGISDKSLLENLKTKTTQHRAPYQTNHAAYLFALNTYIALLAKVVAAKTLNGAAEDVCDAAVPIADRMKSLEDGTLFQQAGLLNMISGDFFSWYATDTLFPNFENHIHRLISKLSDIDFDVSRKSSSATRDLFKGIYETCVPRELRHALGEFYTPDWLAEHGMNVLGWKPENDLLDPTCGSGTFIIEAIKRRIELAKSSGLAVDPTKILNGIWGTDLNPMAVLAAKASVAVFLSPYIQKNDKIRLPIFLSDAVNPTIANNEIFEHSLLTEKGEQVFTLPKSMVEMDEFYIVMFWLQELIDADYDAAFIIKEMRKKYPRCAIESEHWQAIEQTIETIVRLHNQNWNGIWCSILADRFAAGAISNVSHICGNPPWVKWSHLPRDYASFIQKRCRQLGVFSNDSWVGGIEADISTVITHESIDRYLNNGGKLGMFITGTVFTNESSEGFRKFNLHNSSVRCAVLSVEDYKPIKPFDGVSNHPVFFVIEKGPSTNYPVKYSIWNGKSGKQYSNAEDFRNACTKTDLLASPVPGGDPNSNRPWLIGTANEHQNFPKIFTKRDASFTARKGVTTDRNGIFWLNVISVNGDVVTIENLNDIGRTKGIPKRRGDVEVEHVFPLIRGKDVTAFKANPSGHILVPQRGMHGDPDLQLNFPNTYAFLKRFKSELESRSSLKRFQPGQPWYSLWSTGSYTFSKHKVAWREMGGGDFCAAYVGEVDDPILGTKKVVIPDHKIYFINTETADEAHFVTGFLNAPSVRSAINAYASQLSLGTSVAEYVGIPKFDKSNKHHKALGTLAKRLSQKTTSPTDKDYVQIDSLVNLII